MTLEKFLSELAEFPDRRGNAIRKALDANTGTAAWKNQIDHWLFLCKSAPQQAAVPLELKQTVKALISLKTVSYNYQIKAEALHITDERGGGAVSAAVADLLEIVARYDPRLATELADIACDLHIKNRQDIFLTLGV